MQNDSKNCLKDHKIIIILSSMPLYTFSEGRKMRKASVVFNVEISPCTHSELLHVVLIYSTIVTYLEFSKNELTGFSFSFFQYLILSTFLIDRDRLRSVLSKPIHQCREKFSCFITFVWEMRFVTETSYKLRLLRDYHTSTVQL